MAEDCLSRGAHDDLAMSDKDDLDFIAAVFFFAYLCLLAVGLSAIMASVLGVPV